MQKKRTFEPSRSPRLCSIAFAAQAVDVVYINTAQKLQLNLI